MNYLPLLGGLALAITAAPAPAQVADPPGRLLASNCFQCHGTDGREGFEELYGRSANDFVEKFREMQRKSPPQIMDLHARGYTDAQIRLMGQYFSSLPRR